jgi:hypothetical protein
MRCPSYLTADQTRGLLTSGLRVQQWISVREWEGFRFIRWVSVEHSSNRWLVFEKESLDDSRAENVDITACFNDLDPDYPEGICHECESAEQALAKCLELGCSDSSFVRANLIQDIYNAYIAEHGVPARAAADYFTQGDP